MLYLGEQEMSQKTKIKTTLTREDLVREAFNFSEQGWIKEVWYNKKTGEISFSGWMTSNSWNESESKNDVKLGIIESSSISDLEGFYQIDDDFVEIDDECNEIDEEFKIENYDRYYGEESSIVTIDEALDRIEQVAYDGDWYEDIFNKLNESVE